MEAKKGLKPLLRDFRLFKRKWVILWLIAEVFKLHYAIFYCSIFSKLSVLCKLHHSCYSSYYSQLVCLVRENLCKLESCKTAKVFGREKEIWKYSDILIETLLMVLKLLSETLLSFGGMRKTGEGKWLLEVWSKFVTNLVHISCVEG